MFDRFKQRVRNTFLFWSLSRPSRDPVTGTLVSNHVVDDRHGRYYGYDSGWSFGSSGGSDYGSSGRCDGEGASRESD